MLRITKKNSDSSDITLGLEGRIVTDWASVLEQECSELLAQGYRVWLEFSGVTYVDSHGVERLQNLREKGVRFVNCPNLIWGLMSDGSVPSRKQ